MTRIRPPFHRLGRLVLAVPLLVGALAFAQPSTTHAQSLVNVTYSFQSPFQIFCGGRQIVITAGQEHFLGTMTTTPTGAYHFSLRWNVDHVTGVSLVTGDTYVATGTGNIDQYVTPGAGGFSDDNEFHLITQGSASNFLVHQNLHFTVDANGNLTGATVNYWDNCVG